MIAVSLLIFAWRKQLPQQKQQQQLANFFCWGSFLGYLSAGHNRHVVSKTHLRHLSDVAENAEPSVVVSRPSVCWRPTCRCLWWGLGSIVLYVRLIFLPRHRSHDWDSNRELLLLTCVQYHKHVVGRSFGARLNCIWLTRKISESSVPKCW